MLENKSFNIRRIGLEMILDCVNYSLKEDSFILIILEETNFLKLLFKNDNYQTEFISHSYNILKLMLINDHLNNEELELIWNFLDENHNDKDLEKKIIELFEKLLDDLDKNKEKVYCANLLKIILGKNKIEYNDSLYMLSL